MELAFYVVTGYYYTGTDDCKSGLRKTVEWYLTHRNDWCAEVLRDTDPTANPVR